MIYNIIAYFSGECVPIINVHRTLKTGIKGPYLTECDLIQQQGVRDFGQHWFGWWLVAWRHETFTWTSAGLP